MAKGIPTWARVLWPNWIYVGGDVLVLIVFVVYLVTGQMWSDTAGLFVKGSLFGMVVSWLAQGYLHFSRGDGRSSDKS